MKRNKTSECWQLHAQLKSLKEINKRVIVLLKFCFSFWRFQVEVREWLCWFLSAKKKKNGSGISTQERLRMNKWLEDLILYLVNQKDEKLVLAGRV